MNEKFNPNINPKEGSISRSLKRITKIGLLASGLLGASVATDDAETQQKVDFTPKQEETLKISNDEYVLPLNVLLAFQSIVDSTSFLKEARGAYLSHNFLYGDRDTRLESELIQLGYSKNRIQEYISILKGKNIIFSQEDALLKNYETVRAHEWTHKLLAEDISDKDKAVLNEARDFVINDYKNKELASSDSVEADYTKTSSEAEKQALIEKSLKIFKQSQPVLLGSDSGEIISILNNSEEFYAYLIGGHLSPNVENTIREKFPEAIKIFDKLKQKVQEKTKRK